MQQLCRAMAVIIHYNFENVMKILERVALSVGKYSKIHLLNKRVQLYCNACP